MTPQEFYLLYKTRYPKEQTRGHGDLSEEQYELLAEALREVS